MSNEGENDDEVGRSIVGDEEEEKDGDIHSDANLLQRHKKEKKELQGEKIVLRFLT